MRKIKEMLRLKFERGLSIRRIATSLQISIGSVHEYLARVSVMGLSWPLPEELTEQQLEEKLFPPVGPEAAAVAGVVLPDWHYIDTEFKRKGVTLRLLWEEHRSAHPTSLCYSQFCKRFARFRQTLDPRMRQSHKAGEKLFVDYAGMTLPLIDPKTGEIHDVAIFVAALGASSYAYAEATRTQQIADWIASHVRAFAFFGGVPDLLVCDNLKAGVTSSNPYEPDSQRTYEEMAAYYGTAILPARVKRPRDKAKVEASVQIVEERILARLRNRRFFSLVQINEAIAPLLKELNQRQMQGRDHCRAELFAQLDAPALRPLPTRPYELGLWTYARVHVDYHIAVDYRFYSVPYGLLKRQVDVRVSGQIVEVFHKGERVASHVRVPQKYGCSTQADHMPPAHQAYAEWTPERILSWLRKTGEATHQVGQAILDGHPHPQQGFRACLGLVRLGSTYGAARTEAACRKALAIDVASYKSVKAILQNNMDRLPDRRAEPQTPPVEHTNIRGAEYYRSSLEPVRVEASRDASGGVC